MPRPLTDQDWQPLPGGFALRCPAADEALVSGRLPLVLVTPPRPFLPGCGGTLRVESDPVADEPLVLRESNWGYRRSDVQQGWDARFTGGRRDNSLGVLGLSRLVDGSVLFLRERDGRPLPAGGGSIEPGDLRPGMTLDVLATVAGLRELNEETDGFLPGGACEHRVVSMVRYPQRGGRPDLVVEMRTVVDPASVPDYLADRERPLLGTYRTLVVSPRDLPAFLRSWADRVPVCGALWGLFQQGIL